MDDIMLKWHGPPAPDLEPQVVEEVRELLEGGLSNAEELIFHNVMLGDHNDPVVLVWGVEGDPAFHCEFQNSMSEGLKFDIEDFKDAPWYKTLKEHWEP